MSFLKLYTMKKKFTIQFGKFMLWYCDLELVFNFIFNLQGNVITVNSSKVVNTKGFALKPDNTALIKPTFY